MSKIWKFEYIFSAISLTFLFPLFDELSLELGKVFLSNLCRDVQREVHGILVVTIHAAGEAVATSRHRRDALYGGRQRRLVHWEHCCCTLDCVVPSQYVVPFPHSFTGEIQNERRFTNVQKKQYNHEENHENKIHLRDLYYHSYSNLCSLNTPYKENCLNKIHLINT